MIADDIDDFASAELLEEGLAENSTVSYASDLRIFAGYLAERGITAADAITREHVVGFLKESRARGFKGSTRARRTVAIRMWLKFLKARGRIANNPAALMDPPKKERALPRTLSEAEVAAVLDGIAGDAPRDLRDRAMLETLYGCGLRVTELCQLRLEDVVDGGELVRILGKGSKERLVPVGGAAGRALAAYIASARGSFARGNATERRLFLTRLARPFTRQGVFKIIRERSAAAGIAPERVSPHVFRHCFASHMLAHGADIRAIQELLGHADISTTQIYTHVDRGRFAEVHRLHPRH